MEIYHGKGRRTNRRQYRGVAGRAPHRRAARQAGAIERQALYDLLTPHERLERLIGPAKRQRARLLEQIRVC